jgi:putative hemolysin
MLAVVPPQGHCAEHALRGAPANGNAAFDRPGSFQDWLEDAVCNKLVDRTRKPSGLLGLAQRVLSFTELNDFVSTIKPDTRPRQLAALAHALDVRFAFKGLEHLQSVANRPVILFGNHPTGGGNVFGMSLLLANHFSEYRILGNRHMKFIPSLSETMIPVDPFCSGAAANMDALVKLRRDFGTKYSALGVFPAAISSRLSLSRAVITDRDWSDAFMRIARHHDALLVPVWFSGRNRLRYYLAARIRKELGFLALPAEFLRLRGKTIDVVVGKPIAPDVLRHIPRRRAKMSFLRASSYELSREHWATSVAGQRPAPCPTPSVKQPRPPGPLSLGEKVEAKFVDAKSARNAAPWVTDRTADGHMSVALDQASYHIVLTHQDSPLPLASVQALHWGQFPESDLLQISPIKKSFQLPSEMLASGRNWLEIVRFRTTEEFGRLGAARQAWTALGNLAGAMGAETELVGLLTTRRANLAPASLQLELLQKSFGDEVLSRARPENEILGALRHHEWRPKRDVPSIEQLSRPDRVQLIDPMLWHCARMGVRFGAYGLRAGPSPRPCILGRLGGRALNRLTTHRD